MFDDQYEVIVADTPIARHIHHRIRYEVYCLEHGYEDPAQYPDQEERDAWDDHAVHFLVRHRASGEWIAAMRLIRPVGGRLPIQEGMDMPVNPTRHRPGDKAGSGTQISAGGEAWELSRACILSAYRRSGSIGASPDAPAALDAPLPKYGPTRREADPDRRRAGARRHWGRSAAYGSGCRSGGHADPSRLGRWDAPSPATDRTEALWRRRVNGFEVVSGMMRAAVECARAHDVEHIYLLTNNALARMAGRLHLRIHRVGAAREHRGMRYPFVANLNEVVFGATVRSSKMKRLFLECDVPYRYHSSFQRHAVTPFPRLVAADQMPSGHRMASAFRAAG